MSRLLRNQSVRYSEPVPVVDGSQAYSSPPMPIPPSPQQPDKADGGAQMGAGSGPGDAQIKLVCVGDGGCGKTSLLMAYAHGCFPQEYVPTVFENYLTMVTAPNGKKIELALWDTAGQEEYDRLRALSYPDTDVLLLCFSVDSPVSLANIYDKWIPEVSLHCPDVPFLLVGLKADLRDEPAVIQYLENAGLTPVTYEEGNAVAQEYGAYKYKECSAVNREGLKEIFDSAITLATKKQRSASGLFKDAPPSPRRLPPTPQGKNTKARTPNTTASKSSVQNDKVTKSNPTKKPKKKSRRCVIL